ncbi:ATP-binding cassette sub-family G member 4-like [Saccoglossus kowalevskii]
MERVDDVLSQMGLLECSNHIIGDKAQTMGISGGQAKRLSVAAEILSIVIGLIFLQLDYNQTSIQNITGCLFFVMAAVSNDSFFPVVQLVPKEWPIVLREHFNGMYRIDVYFIAKWMTEDLTR